MVRIKRSKTAPLGPGQTAPLPPAIHYAVTVAPAGNVTSWTADAEKAGEFSPEVAARVREFYASVANAGTLTLEPVAKPEPPAAPAAAPAPAPKVEAPKPVEPKPPEPVKPATLLPEPEPEKAGRKAHR